MTSAFEQDEVYVAQLAAAIERTAEEWVEDTEGLCRLAATIGGIDDRWRAATYLTRLRWCERDYELMEQMDRIAGTDTFGNATSERSRAAAAFMVEVRELVADAGFVCADCRTPALTCSCTMRAVA